MATEVQEKPETEPSATGSEPRFGVNEMRLGWRQWLAVAAIMLVCLIGIPRAWKVVERFDTGPDYRIPYPLSADYWLYQWNLNEVLQTKAIPVLGDSVVWGEYVLRDGTLSHFLNREAGGTSRFANLGVNGVFPLAMEGLVADYGGPLRNRKVIVQCNILWMSSPKADLSTPNEETFNHSQLVPQFSPRIPCYRADAATRLGAVAWRSSGFMAWVNHLDSVYFDQKSIPAWTLEEDAGDPPLRPNAWKNPVSRISLQVPGEPAADPQRGPASPRHKPWNSSGRTPSHFDWVGLDASLQWQAFKRTVDILRSRGNDVLVILGPFNEHMVASDQIPTVHAITDGIKSWLASSHVPSVAPDTLASELYADASHPLTEGYARLASQIYSDPEFQRWLSTKPNVP